ncbi:glycoside hydrolase family 9 protein [Streptomyces sp. NPDC058534]|uniref:glycoside hydrolase family 9 protein n=1 Tax=Streptomyces sp. NPDC058534 TaxID=3346541 RepID=UPI003661D6B6
MPGLEAGRKRAAGDPFRSGVVPGEFDAAPRTFGLLATAELYARVTGDHRYDDFAAGQLAWVFGANAWGTGFVVGAGDLCPYCPHHQVANLAMSHTGRGDILRGAVVNGPNDAGLLSDRDAVDAARPCAYAPDDFTSTALYALSLAVGRT